MDAIKNNADDHNISNIFTVTGCLAGLAAYDISKRLFQPSNSGGGCFTRSGYYILMGTIALSVGQKVTKLITETYNNCKSIRKE